MLIVKSKYRIARRLGAGVFDQTQTQKFALREGNRAPKKRGRAPSDYAKQLLEKQRIRFTYGITEGSLSKYAAEAIQEKNPGTSLHRKLEMRADMIVYRAGLASTRRAARQMVSHGHIMVNGTRITTPSMFVKKGSTITVREGSRRLPLFAALAEKSNDNRAIPSWLDVDISMLQAKVIGEPSYSAAEVGLDYGTLFEFYSR